MTDQSAAIDTAITRSPLTAEALTDVASDIGALMSGVYELLQQSEDGPARTQLSIVHSLLGSASAVTHEAWMTQFEREGLKKEERWKRLGIQLETPTSRDNESQEGGDEA